MRWELKCFRPMRLRSAFLSCAPVRYLLRSAKAKRTCFAYCSNAGEKNGVKNLRVIKKEEALALEPYVSPELSAALYSADAGITNPFELTYALKENAEKNGARFEFGFEAVTCEHTADAIKLGSASGGYVTAKNVINCAGEGAGPVARMLGDLVYMKHRMGEYVLFDKPSAVRMPVFGVPDERGKGVLVSPAVSGKFFIGPTSVESKRVPRIFVAARFRNFSAQPKSLSRAYRARRDLPSTRECVPPRRTEIFISSKAVAETYGI